VSPAAPLVPATPLPLPAAPLPLPATPLPLPATPLPVAFAAPLEPAAPPLREGGAHAEDQSEQAAKSEKPRLTIGKRIFMLGLRE
jgi:hypothetical protein